MEVHYIHVLLTVYKPSNLSKVVVTSCNQTLDLYKYLFVQAQFEFYFSFVITVSVYVTVVGKDESVPVDTSIYSIYCIYREITVIAPFILNFSALFGGKWSSCFALFY
jgi:hypothetical protein